MSLMQQKSMARQQSKPQIPQYSNQGGNVRREEERRFDSVPGEHDFKWILLFELPPM